jgi:hypothetical protein
MPHYHHHTSYHRQKRFIRRTRVLAALIILLLGLAGLAVFIDSNRESDQAAVPSMPSSPVSSSFAPPVEVFRTPFFQFQVNNNWKAVAAESGENRFVYRSFRDTLAEHTVTITVGDEAEPIATTRVLPVIPGQNNRLLPAQVSEHCRTALPPDNIRQPKEVVMNDVRFRCNPDSSDYTVSVGLSGGRVPMRLKRPNGTTVSYSIVYQNVMAQPHERELQELISSFQTR